MRAADTRLVRARREIPEIGVTVLTLSNGVEVWLSHGFFATISRVHQYARGARRWPSPAEFLDASLSTALIGAQE